MSPSRTAKKSPKSKKQVLPKKIRTALKNLPKRPGVYEMLSEKNEALYVGKAKDLRKRVQTYFRPATVHSPRIQKMLEKTKDIFWTEVSSEVEALILESNLIKEKRPKFNILLRDDKNFAYFCITMAEDFPRIFLTRRIVRDGSIYIGPKTSASAVRQTIDLLHDIFELRSTNLFITEKRPGEVEVKNPGNIRYPCLNFHIGKCAAPCIGNISKEEYRKRIEKAVRFLRGHGEDTLKDLYSRMQDAAGKKEFEKAAHLRDLFQAVQTISEKQVISAPDEFSADVIGAVEKFGRSFFHLFQIRSGKVINSETFSVSLENAENITEALYAFLREHGERAADIPKYVLLSADVFPERAQEAWEQFFSQKWEQVVRIHLPQKGKRKKLLDLAEQNAEGYARRNAASFLQRQEDATEVLQVLQKKLQMERLPERIECYDISHLGGSDTVASMTVMEDGVLKPAHYRRFQLQTIEHGEIDDFKSMKEVMVRRLRHLEAREESTLPATLKIAKPTKKEQEKIQEILQNQDGKKLEKTNAPKKFWIVRDKAKEIVGFAGLLEKDDVLQISPFWIEKEWHGKGTLETLFDTVFFSLQKGKVYLDSAVKELRDHALKRGFQEILNAPDIFSPPRSKQKKLKVMMAEAKKKKKDVSLSTNPDLIVIDGGKGQLSSANAILQEFSFEPPIYICSLAKKQEEVFIPEISKPLAIAKDSPEGQLLQNLRDEAHRFAVSYHKKLHQKNQKKSVLDSLPGIGAKTRKKLLQQFGSLEGIRAATDRVLLNIVNKKQLAVLRRQI